MGTIKT